MTKQANEFKDKTNYDSKEYLHINSCGKQYNHNSKYTILRTKGRLDYHILYIIQGACEVEQDNKMEILNAGDLIIYKPNKKQLYKFTVPNTVSYWIHFSGIGAEEMLKRSNLWTKSIYTPGHNETIISLFDTLIQETTMKEYQYSLLCEGKLLELISVFSRLTMDNTFADTNNNINTIYPIIEKMREHYTEKIDVDKFAVMCGLSKSRFEHVFKEATGLPPYRYQLKIRLDKALYLINNSNLNISEISATTGFSDPLYFSRIFKRYNGISPYYYRKTYGADF